MAGSENEYGYDQNSSPTNSRKSAKQLEEDEIMNQIDESHHQKPISHLKGLFWATMFGVARGGMYASTKISEDMVQVQTH
jgi:hypothetical protein